MAAAAALAAALSAMGCASGPRAATRTVVVEGWAPLGAQPRPEARRRAVADAQRRAIEEAAGVEVAAVAAIDDAGVIRERVSTSGRGTLLGWRVLGESVRDGMLGVRVRAEVEIPKPGENRRPGWIPGTGPRARFVAAGGEVGAAAKAALRRAWMNYGGTGAGDDGAAELVLTAAVEESLVDEPRLKPFVAVRVRLTVDAAHAAGGAALWSASRESSALGLDARQACGRALEAAADAVAREAAEGLPARLWLTARRDAR
jgi:hypothetical protein